jgi:hypothetical protein
VKEVPEHWKKGWLMRGWLLHRVQGSCKQMLQELYNALDFVNSDKFSQNETIMSDIITVGTEMRIFFVCLKKDFNLHLSLDCDLHEDEVSLPCFR